MNSATGVRRINADSSGAKPLARRALKSYVRSGEGNKRENNVTRKARNKREGAACRAAMGDADCDTPSGGACAGERFRNLSPRGVKGRGADSAVKKGRPPSAHRRLEKRPWINGAPNGAKG